MYPLRSWLFAPGNHAGRVDKALGLDADAIVLDLEDACRLEEKIEARQAVAAALTRRRRSRAYVRVNALSTEFAYGDLRTVVGPHLDGIMLPKIESGDGVKITDWLIGQLEREQGMTPGSVDLMPLVETALGMANLDAIARAVPRVRRLAFGAGDLTLDLSMRWSPGEEELMPFRASMVLVSRAAGLEPPIDTVWMDVGDQKGMARSASRARSHGFQGKLCIHPSQATLVNAAFESTEAEIAKARRVIAAFEAAGSACVLLDGQLIEYPVVEGARRVLAAAQARGAQGRRDG
jgi:citrate lyase subunit beta / citryl-CoA lyase